jgi:DNA-directed RNA polymerase I subunit RPA43
MCPLSFGGLADKVDGTHSLSSPSHISLLFSKTFNISIPLQHIPTDTLEFEHTAPGDDAESDSEFEDDLSASGVEEVGRWKRKSDGKLLGEGGKPVKFTVIGRVHFYAAGSRLELTIFRMQVTNQMLSLTGSLLDDPTNPPPPQEIQSVRAPSPTLSQMDIEDEPAPPPKKHKQTNGKDKTHKSAAASNGHAPAQVQVSVPEVAPSVVEPEVDERFLSARELKKKHKEDAKRKRDERKSRKEDKQIEAMEEAGGEMMVGMHGNEEEVGMKRKAEDGGGEGKKRKKA